MSDQMSDPPPQPEQGGDLERITPMDLFNIRSGTRHRSPVSIFGRAAGAAIVCATCQGAGRFLADEADALAQGWIVLQRRQFLGRWRVETPCHCAAGMRTIRDWQQLPPDSAGVTFAALFDVPDQDQAIASAEAFCANPIGWLTFGGDYGVGKTALLYATLNTLAERHVFGRYITAPDLIDKLRNIIRNGGDPDAYLDRWCAAPLIAIDEIDKYDSTEFAEKSIFRLFNARYQRLATAGTLLAYNLDREARLPAFLRSRIDDGRSQWIKLIGGDVRPALDPWDRGEGEP